MAEYALNGYGHAFYDLGDKPSYYHEGFWVDGQASGRGVRIMFDSNPSLFLAGDFKADRLIRGTVIRLE